MADFPADLDHEHLMLRKKRKQDFNLQFKRSEFANLMMTLTLQNRFVAFHDWFRNEMQNGAATVEDVAEIVFTKI